MDRHHNARAAALQFVSNNVLEVLATVGGGFSEHKTLDFCAKNDVT